MGGWGKAANKAKLSPAGAGSWAELGKIQRPVLKIVGEVLIVLMIGGKLSQNVKINKHPHSTNLW